MLLLRQILINQSPKNIMKNAEDIKRIIGRTWFNVSEEGDEIIIDSREYGDVGEESYGEKDLKEGRRIIRLLRETGLSCSIEGVDEWVIVTVKL